MKRIMMAILLCTTLAPVAAQATTSCGHYNGAQLYCGSTTTYKAKEECKKQTGNNSGHTCDDEIHVCKCNSTPSAQIIDLDLKQSKKLGNLVQQFEATRQ